MTGDHSHESSQENASVLTSVKDSVLTVTINRPAVLNALDPGTHRQLSDVFDDFSCNDALHIAVITGCGDRAFCVGSDLKVRASLGRDDMPATGYAGLTERFDLTKPVVAAINGHAIGGGLEIVLACDLAIAVRGAKFGLPEPKVGLAASGGLHRLARYLPMKQAMQIALCADLFSADEAHHLGLINAVVDDDGLPGAIEAILAQLKACSPLALRATKEMMLRGLDAGGLSHAYARDYPGYQAMLDSEDAREGMAAFNNKRPPHWQGR